MHRQLRTVCFVLQADAETHSLEEAKAGVEAEHQELQELRGAHNRKIGQRTIKIRKLEDLIKRCALPPIARRFATDRQTSPFPCCLITPLRCFATDCRPPPFVMPEHTPSLPDLPVAVFSAAHFSVAVASPTALALSLIHI